MFRKDGNKNGGGLILYINEGIPGNSIRNGYYWETLNHLHKMNCRKWNKTPLNFSSSSYENFLLLGDLNLSTENPNFKKPT